MLDIKLIRERPDFVRQRLALRGAGDEARVDEVLRLDDQRRKVLNEVELLKAQRNKASKEIGALMGQKKTVEAEAKKKKPVISATKSRSWTNKRMKRMQPATT